MSHPADFDSHGFESLMAPMADLIGLGYWLLAPNSAQVFVSASFYKLLGYTSESCSLEVAACLDRVHPKDKPLLAALLGPQDSQLPCQHRLRIRHENGIWHWFEVKGGTLAQDCYALTFLDISEFKEIEAAAVDSQLRYHSLYSTSPLAIILWNKEGQITEWNRRAESTFGWLSHEVVGRPIHRLLFAEGDRDIFSTTVKDLARGEGNGRCTTDNLTKQGQNLRCHWSNVLLRNNQGTLIGIMSLVEDHTDSWAMECEIRHNEAMYRALVETSPDAIFLLDTRGSISMANYQAARLAGLDDLSELIGSPFQQLLPAGNEAEFCADVLANPDDYIGLIGSNEISLKRADGRHFDGEISYTATTNHEGRANGLIVVGRDITQRKRTQQELKDHRDHLEKLVQARTAALETAQETLAQIIEGCPVPIFVVDTQNQVTHWNHASEMALGVTAAQLVGSRDQWQPFYETDRPVLADLVVKGRKDDIPRYYGDKIRPSPLVEQGYEGSDYFPSLERWYQFTAAPVKNRQGEVIAAIETLVDITASKAAENTLIEARQLAESAAKMKAEFLANMSHEIRTPLNAVMGLTRLLRQTALDSRQQEYAEKIFNASRMLLALLNDLLDFSKIEAGQLSLESADFQLDELLDNVATIVQTPARDKGLELHFIPSPQVPATLRGDSLRLTQVMVNLLSNAIKFTSQGHVAVTLDVAHQGSDDVCLQVAVQDTGIGLSPEQQSRLFQAFSQADTSTSRKFGGTGLGLIICRRLVELMGGTIHLDSTPGVGSTFTFTANLGKPPAVGMALPHFAGQRALVVDDHPLARAVLTEQLGLLGFSCCAVGTAAEFKQAITQTFDWVFLDWVLPDISGHELAKQVRLRLPKSKLLLVTATDPQVVRDAVAPSLLDAILSKPLILTKLAQTLATLSGLAASPTPMAAPTQPLGGLKILVVDDIATNRFIASELLQSLGASVELAESGQQALTLIGESDGRFDVVLMDVQMPDIDGVETAGMIKANPALATLPVIAMTAHAMESEIKRCKACGMVDYVGKPIDPDTLVQVVRRWGLGPTGLPRIPTGTPSTSASTPAGETPQGGPQAGSLPGIDLAEGLRRLMNKRDLFDRVVKDFYTRFKGEAVLIREAISSGDKASAERMAHTIKGLAGSIGAKELQAAAARLEDAIYSGHSDIEALRTAFESALETVLKGLQLAYALD